MGQNNHHRGERRALIVRSKLWLAGIVGFLAVTCGATAQETAGVTGRWLTEDRRGVIAIAPCGNSICGKIDWMKFPPGVKPGEVPRDRHNRDPAQQTQPICGLQIIYGFHHDAANPKRWLEGHIYDPESGDTYHASITVVDANHLRLRGYIGIPLLGESQVWTRADANHPPCHVG
jgi:uncharacterized protein (DUF2147 family)